MTNEQRIKSMTAAELAGFLDNKVLEWPCCRDDAPIDLETRDCRIPSCSICWLEWLMKEEAE